MGRKCWICRDDKLQTAAIHHFPDDEDRLNKWLEFCSLSESCRSTSECDFGGKVKVPLFSLQNHQGYARSVHFNNESFINPTCPERGLKKDALPSMYALQTLNTSTETDSILIDQAQPFSYVLSKKHSIVKYWQKKKGIGRYSHGLLGIGRMKLYKHRL